MAAIVEVVVGIIFVYILLSILVTEINNLVSRAGRLRSRNLRGALDEMLQDPVTQARIYTHPLIQLVKADEVPANMRITEAEARKIAGGRVSGVDYIEPSAFVEVALGAVKTSSEQQLYGAMLNIIDGMPAGREKRGLRRMANHVMSTGQGIGQLRASLAYVRQPQYRSALADSLNQIDDRVVTLGLRFDGDAALLAGLRQGDNPHFRGALGSVLATASTAADARTQLETWFNGAMTRASASYAAKMKTLSLGVALALVLAVNIDTWQIAQTLWEDPIRREQISSEASATVGSGEMNGEAIDSVVVEGDFTASGVEGAPDVGDVIEAGASLANRLQDIQNLRLPVGWRHEDLSLRAQSDPARLDPNNLWNYSPENNPDGWLTLLFGKLLGIGATVIAAAQGAPFWFGIVKRIVSR